MKPPPPALETAAERAPSAGSTTLPGKPAARLRVALLTAGRDKPYALGLGPALAAQGLDVDFIGSDTLDDPIVRNVPRIRFLNLRNQAVKASLWTKMTRVLAYYVRLIAYAAGSQAQVFHILWNNKFEHFDRTVMMLYYRLLGKRVVFTAHNVNIGKRDGNDSWLNRLTLRIQYRLCHQIFVHTKLMQDELAAQFGIPADRVTVIPFGINNTLPTTPLTRTEARDRLQLGPSDKALLFFGNIAPYKGLHVLVAALAEVAAEDPSYRLVIAGRTKGSEDYWLQVEQSIRTAGLESKIRAHVAYIADDQVEQFFKAADVLILPYMHVFQSGVLFLSYGFGLPVIATDVGSLREDIVEGRTGYVCPPDDSAGLSRAIRTYFASEAYRECESRRPAIQAYVNKRYSWTTVGEITKGVYEQLLSSSRSEPTAKNSN